MILAIDSTAGTSAAVVSGGMVLGFVNYDDPFGHAENVGRAIETAFERASAVASDIERVVVSRGPASYTGLRVGMASGFGFAAARKIPIHGVVALDAVADYYCQGYDFDRWLVTSDAKRGEQFVAVYSGFDGSGLPLRALDPVVMKPLEVEQSYQGLERVNEPSDARAVGLYAEKAIAAGFLLNDISPLYLRSPDVTPGVGKRVSG